MNIDTFKTIVTLAGVAISMGLLISGLISFAKYQQAGRNAQKSQDNL